MKKIRPYLLISLLLLCPVFVFSDGGEIFLYSPNVEKGTTILVKIISPTEPKIYFGFDKIKPDIINNAYVAIIPVDIADSRDKEYLDIVLGDKLHVYTVNFKECKYRTRTLTLRGKNRKFFPGNSKVVEEAQNRLKQEEQIVSVRDSYNPACYFDARFIFPIKNYKRNLFYGDLRLVKRGREKTRYFHRGVDFAAPKGTPVLASNSGKVVVARRLSLRGNTVIVDHGLGIYSEYLHLSRILVKEGQNIKKSQVVGRVGSTGRSTGPHLHWSLVVRGVLVNPVFLTNSVFDDIFSSSSALTRKQPAKKSRPL